MRLIVFQVCGFCAAPFVVKRMHVAVHFSALQQWRYQTDPVLCGGFVFDKTSSRAESENGLNNKRYVKFHD